MSVTAQRVTIRQTININIIHTGNTQDSICERGSRGIWPSTIQIAGTAHRSPFRSISSRTDRHPVAQRPIKHVARH
jgi:hypothetical protein